MLVHGRAIVAEEEFGVTCPEECPFTGDQERDWIRASAEDSRKLMLVAESSGRILMYRFVKDSI